MHDLILEIDDILWWVVIAFTLLAAVLYLLMGEKDIKRETDIIINKTEPKIQHTLPGADKSIVTLKKATIISLDSVARSEYRSAKLLLCACEIKTLERLKLITDSRIESEPIQRQSEIKRDLSGRKRGIWD